MAGSTAEGGGWPVTSSMRKRPPRRWCLAEEAPNDGARARSYDDESRYGHGASRSSHSGSRSANREAGSGLSDQQQRLPVDGLGRPMDGRGGPVHVFLFFLFD